jgi:hypothetical protein
VVRVRRGPPPSVAPGSAGSTFALPQASIQQTEAFLNAYQAMRGTPWNREEEETCWAAGMWVLTYNAKETLGGGGGYLKHLEREASERMRRAGI